MNLISLFIITFLLLGAFFIVSNEGLHLQKEPDRIVFVQHYGLWMFKLLSNSYTITGNLLKFDWLP